MASNPRALSELLQQFQIREDAAPAIAPDDRPLLPEDRQLLARWFRGMGRNATPGTVTTVLVPLHIAQRIAATFEADA
jgi:hypothetical protein